MRILTPYLSALVLIASLSGCNSILPTHAPTPDYRIQVVPSASGRSYVAKAPECPKWGTVMNTPNVNQRMPQIGCANARNLAAQIERPMDLIKPRPLGPPDTTVSAGSISAYRAGKTKALIDPNADAPITETSTGTGSE